jgi:hypothetical protein
MKTTRKQREAIKRVYDRCRISIRMVDADGYGYRPEAARSFPGERKASYRDFRKIIQTGHDCLMVKWCGMWLGIESDGYTHS